jgi:hypothetical protein
LIGKVDTHPELIVLPSMDRETTWKLLKLAISFLKRKGEPTSTMQNHILEVKVSGKILFLELPQ